MNFLQYLPLELVKKIFSASFLDYLDAEIDSESLSVIIVIIFFLFCSKVVAQIITLNILFFLGLNEFNLKETANLEICSVKSIRKECP